MKDAVATMGTILDDSIQGRDAVHVAVITVEAREILLPGEDVAKDGLGANPNEGAVGIVDPFLKAPVKKGQRFWLFLYPRTITSLNHSWTHPAFSEEVPTGTAVDAVRKSEQWLRSWVEHSDCPSYELLVGAATGGYSARGPYGDSVHASLDDEYLIVSGQDASGEIPNEVWDHVEVVTGRKVAVRPKYFSCSC